MPDLRAALGPNQEGCEDPDCSRTECLHLGICWGDAFWAEGPDSETPEKGPEGRRDGRTPQTLGASEGQGASGAREG